MKRRKPDFLVFYADDVWEVIAQETTENALKTEAELAKLADVVVIVVESPGTFAELGAFSLSDPLRAKLLPIINYRHKDASSFINSGPVRWIEAESQFAPIIWTDTSTILNCVPELEDRLGRIPKPKARTIKRNGVGLLRPPHQLFLVYDFLSIFGPVTSPHLTALMRTVAPLDQNRVNTLLGLVVAMDMAEVRDLDGTKYFLPKVRKDFLKPHLKAKFFDLPSARAEVLSVLMSIPKAREVLIGI